MYSYYSWEDVEIKRGTTPDIKEGLSGIILSPLQHEIVETAKQGKQKYIIDNEVAQLAKFSSPKLQNLSVKCESMPTIGDADDFEIAFVQNMELDVVIVTISTKKLQTVDKTTHGMANIDAVSIIRGDNTIFLWDSKRKLCAALWRKNYNDDYLLCKHFYWNKHMCLATFSLNDAEKVRFLIVKANGGMKFVYVRF